MGVPSFGSAKVEFAIPEKKTATIADFNILISPPWAEWFRPLRDILRGVKCRCIWDFLLAGFSE
jgi:hypothetical protein